MVDVRVQHLRSAAEIPVADARADRNDALIDEHGLREQVEAWTALPSTPGHGPALLCVDCDRFKTLSEHLSPGFRERLVDEVGRRLARHAGKSDKLVRTGTDRFLFGVAPLDQPEGALRVAGNIVQEFATPVSVDKIDVHLSVSVGIALFPEDGLDPSALAGSALQAAWEVKRGGGNDYARPARSDLL